MGIIVSKENRNRTKKVQQTAAVMSALKLASKESKEKHNPTANQAQASQTSQILQETKHDKVADEHLDFDREHTANLNYDTSSITYGLPELDGADYHAYSSGTTGYWDKSDKAVVSIPYFGAWKRRVENEELCSLCGVYTGVEVHPCRVCCKVFHELCLKKKGKLYGKTELEAFRKANTDKGWSCHDCESLTSLLTDEEMQQLIENFDRLVNQDTQINEDEYVRYQKIQYKDIHKEQMPSYMEEETRNEFKQIDKDHTGTIDWWEFLNHEALKSIAKNRSKFQLVRMLSPIEIQKARDIFHAFDKDEDGYINSHEVAVGFTRWFGNLRVFDHSNPRTGGGSSSFGRPLDPKDVSGHIDRHSRMFMDADTDNNRLVSWDEYLREQALYILAARPNI